MDVDELLEEKREADEPAGIPYARPAEAPLAYAGQGASVRGDPLLVRLRVGDALLDLLIVFGLVLGVMLGKDFVFADWSEEQMRARTPLFIVGIGVFASLLAPAYVAGRGQNLASLGLRTERWAVDVGIGVLAAGFIMALMAAGSVFVYFFVPELAPALQESQRGIQEVLPPMSPAGIVGLTAVVAFYEELLFRGFLLTRLRVLTRRWWPAVLMGMAGFATLHWYQGPLAVLAILLLSGVLSVLFIWRRGLVAPVTAHFVFNVTQLLLLQYGPKMSA